MNSMTGYGYREVIVDDTQISVEIKSVNSRFLDLNINMPSFLNSLESTIRWKVNEKIVRGKVDLNIRVKDLKSTADLSVDLEAAKKYFNAMAQIQKECTGQDELKMSDTLLGLIVQQDGVMVTNHTYDAQSYWNRISPIFDQVMEQYVADRKREGENLKKDLLEKLDVLDRCADFFALWQPQMETKFREQMTNRFQELLGDHADENRIMTEVAAMMVKYTINEEIIRLKSHLGALRKELNENPIPGKKMDFICQEANREINTIGSKNQFTEVGAMVVTAKDALENIREQSKNVE